jgi:hypothetical protein
MLFLLRFLVREVSFNDTEGTRYTNGMILQIIQSHEALLPWIFMSL